MSYKEPKRIAVWDYQVDDLRPNEAARTWLASSDINSSAAPFAYRVEIWVDQFEKYKAVMFCFARHPITGGRYVNYRTKKRSRIALAEPVVLNVSALPPQAAIDNYPD